MQGRHTLRKDVEIKISNRLTVVRDHADGKKVRHKLSQFQPEPTATDNKASDLCVLA